MNNTITAKGTSGKRLGGLVLLTLALTALVAPILFASTPSAEASHTNNPGTYGFPYQVICSSGQVAVVSPVVSSSPGFSFQMIAWQPVLFKWSVSGWKEYLPGPKYNFLTTSEGGSGEGHFFRNLPPGAYTVAVKIFWYAGLSSTDHQSGYRYVWYNQVHVSATFKSTGFYQNYWCQL